jgi:hypothetical protein
MDGACLGEPISDSIGVRPESQVFGLERLLARLYGDSYGYLHNQFILTQPIERLRAIYISHVMCC